MDSSIRRRRGRARQRLALVARGDPSRRRDAQDDERLTVPPERSQGLGTWRTASQGRPYKSKAEHTVRIVKTSGSVVA